MHSSVLIAFMIGTIEWLQVIGARLSEHGIIWGWIVHLDYGTVGYLVVGIFIVSWVVAGIVYKFKRFETVFEDVGT